VEESDVVLYARSREERDLTLVAADMDGLLSMWH
jgi:hypothetical protein